jgi:hypothetical protein
MPNKKIMWYAVAVLVMGYVWVASAEDTSGLPTTAAPETKPAVALVPKVRRIVEPESGVLFLLDASWKRKYTEEGTGFVREGAVPAVLIVRYPPDFKVQPDSAEALRDQDIRQAVKKPEWKKEHRKSVDATWQVPVLPDDLVVISNGIESTRNKTTFLLRNFYLTSPIKGVIAVSCELPVDAVNADDVCVTFVKSAKLLSPEERKRRAEVQSMVDRLDQDSRKDDVACSKVNEENKEYRSFYPNAKLEEIPRFKALNTIMLATYFSKMDKVKPDKMKEFLALLQEVPVQLKRLENECVAHPEESYSDAVNAVFKTEKSVSK